MVGKGGALPRCCAPPHEQIFDIPALSRGGGAQTAKFPPPSGLIGLTLPRVGTREQARVCSPETHSRTPTAAYTLKGNNGRLKTLEELSTSNSLHAAVPGGSHFRFGRLSLFIRQAGTQCGINGQGLRAHPPPQPFRSLHCPKVRMQCPAFPKSRGAASASVSARAWQPHVWQPPPG